MLSVLQAKRMKTKNNELGRGDMTQRMQMSKARHSDLDRHEMGKREIQRHEKAYTGSG